MGWEFPVQSAGEANRLRNVRYGSAGGYAGMAGEAYAHDANDMQQNIANQQQAIQAQQANEGAQQAFERGLQSQEQQRRAYDSNTARMGQQQKFNVLGNLLGAPRRMG